MSPDSHMKTVFNTPTLFQFIPTSPLHSCSRPPCQSWTFCTKSSCGGLVRKPFRLKMIAPDVLLISGSTRTCVQGAKIIIQDCKLLYVDFYVNNKGHQSSLHWSFSFFMLFLFTWTIRSFIIILINVDIYV